MPNASQVLLGSVGSSDVTVTCEPADPASFPAGVAVRQKSDGGLLITANGTASLIGVSRGPDLSATKQTSVARTGNFIPLLVDDVRATMTLAELTFNAHEFGAAGNGITVTLADETTDGSAVIATDPDSPTDIIINIQAGVTTAQQIADAVTADYVTAALIEVVIADGEEATAQNDDDGTLADGADVAAKGAVVQLDDTTGYGVVSGTATGAVYLSGVLRGLYTDGTEVPCAYVAMPGGF